MKTILSFLILFSFSCNSQDCSKINTHFTSYQQAISEVENAKFKISESVNTSQSSWIQSAHYYSCDGLTGYFIFKTHDKEYLYQDVPREVWNGFKNAASFGSYYDVNIKHRYQLYLN